MLGREQEVAAFGMARLAPGQHEERAEQRLRRAPGGGDVVSRRILPPLAILDDAMDEDERDEQPQAQQGDEDELGGARRRCGHGRSPEVSAQPGRPACSADVAPVQPPPIFRAKIVHAQDPGRG